MTTEKSRSSYHHGDARNALLQAARELLEGSGAAGLSLRQVAERAGLSRQAPYNHFDDKAALLAELIADGFARLRDAMRTAQEEGDSPEDRLRRACAAYIAFAQGSPALFRLMFASELVNPVHHPEVAKGQESALDVVRSIVAGLASADAVDDLTLTAWAVVHGYATLCIEAGLEPVDMREQRAALFARIIATSA